ncbi:TRAP transporter substrate-binding protein [Rhodospirillum sp. A1_3_36]|uniref:TRAP transporter substrate-binding protein n=1 Tax=Rhodospirillum sp. A1_3_36 TaxID=3391666 RepID=UPI0039A6E645
MFLKTRAAILAVALTLGVSPMALAPTPASATERLKIGTPTPPPHIFTKAGEHLATALKETSGGAYLAKVHPSNTLGDAPTMISLLQSGALELAILPAGDLARREESFLGWFLPYTFPTLAEAGRAAKTPAAREMLARLDDEGVVGLGYVFPGQRHLLSTFPVTAPADLVNKKVRAFPNEIFKDWWLAVGAAPTALPLPDIAQALTTGVIDAVDVDLDIIVGLKLHKQAPYLTLTDHMAFPGLILASKSWWDGLSAEDQDRIRALTAETETWALDTQLAKEDANLEALKADGVTVTEPDLDAFKAVGARVTEKYVALNPLIARFHDEALAAR